MSKSIHTTRQHYRKARDDDFGSKKAKDGVLAAIRDELQEKRKIKSVERRRKAGRKAGAPSKVRARSPRPDEELRPAQTLPHVAIEEFGRARKTPDEAAPQTLNRT